MALKLETVSRCGYNNCLQLKNKNATIVIEPNCGGRIIEYSIGGENIIYLNPEEDGYLASSGEPPLSNLSPCGGRCDVGPEMITPVHPDLWLDRWEVVHADELGIIIRSKKDRTTGLQLERFFKLSDKSTHLTFTQTIRNLSHETIRCFHWSRTFAVGGGVAIAPINPHSRFPKGYVVYGPGDVIDYMPEDEPNVIKSAHNELMIKGEPSRAKFAMDLSEGWLAYIAKTDLLFVKKFPVYPDRIYGEILSNNLSIWYNKEEMCELEPIGPLEIIEPKEETSYTEDWWLFNHPYHKVVKNHDLTDIKEKIKAL